jgi:SAM-dependent methyltransferase
VNDVGAPADGRPARLRPLLAGVLVFVCSAAVLMLEILAGRLLAPYVGISLQTYTSIIGTVLAGIALGAWAGGRVADRVDPHRLLGPVIAIGGVLAFCTVPIIRALGSQSAESPGASTLVLSFAAFFLPAVVLSAVTPMVVKLQLHDLSGTGSVVGRLSGISTAGALVGTFVTGFVLVATTPTRTIIYVVGATLVALGVALSIWLSRRDSVVLVLIVAMAAGGFTLGVVASEPCQVESAYYCMRIERDVFNSDGRILWLDNVRHSYVDLADPTHLEFDYTRSFADAVATAFPGSQPLEALHIGGGGFTFPRYLAATRPGTQSTVLEIDLEVLDLARAELGLRTSPALRVRIGDARLGIRGEPNDSRDLVVGDAFGSLSVPWHLTTREFLREIDRVLRPRGIYVQNVIDYPTFRFARAQLATLRERFEYVAAVAPQSSFDGLSGSNVVLIASHHPLDHRELAGLVREHGDVVLDAAALDRFIGSAPVITDDFAPVDQWLNQDSAS